MTRLDPIGAETVERLLARDPADVERVLPIDNFQRELTDHHILPVLPQLEEEFLAIRETVDAKIRQRLEEARANGKSDVAPDKYPKGFCLQISVEAVAEFEARNVNDPSPGYQAVTAFRRAGGHVTKVWGVLRNEYFQNALQFGSIYFDVSNDTVDVTKPKVEYMPMAESGFKNIESYAEFADVAERYWNCRIYPNLHFPRLAPLLPILKLSPDGVLSLDSCVYFMQRLNVDSGFRASETFLTSNDWTDKRLPDEWLERIRNYKTTHLSAEARTPRDGVESSEAARLCAEYRVSTTYTSRPFLTRVFHSAATVSIESR